MGWITKVYRIKGHDLKKRNLVSSHFLSCKLLSAAPLSFLHSCGCHGHSLNWPPITRSNEIFSRALDSSLVLFLTSFKCCILLHLMGSGKVPLTTVPVFHIGSESHGPNILTIHKLPWGLMPLQFSPITQQRSSLLTPSLYVCHPRNIKPQQVNWLLEFTAIQPSSFMY